MKDSPTSLSCSPYGSHLQQQQFKNGSKNTLLCFHVGVEGLGEKMVIDSLAISYAINRFAYATELSAR
jgi:hypothetical protein